MWDRQQVDSTLFLCSDNWFCLEKVEDADMATSVDVNTVRGDELPPYTGLTSSVIPKAEAPKTCVCSYTGVSTRSVQSLTPQKNDEPHWYALRTTYGREKKAYDFIIQHEGQAFFPTIMTEKTIKGKKTRVEISRIPNIFFAYGTEDFVKSFVYDNENLPFLRFYYKHIHSGNKIDKVPMIVPDNQIRSLQIICEKEGSDTLILQEEVEKFQKGEKVRIIEGDFVGVTGIVARYHGQQRVGLVIEGLLTAVTAYIPTAFLEKIL